MKVVNKWETELTEDDHDALSLLLRAAFGEHGDEFAGRSWPLSFARKDARIWLADELGRPVAHLAVGRRVVGVGGTDVLVAGVGDVAVAPQMHGQGTGKQLMAALDEALRGPLAARFGFVICGEPTVPFYERTGWTRIANPVRHVDPENHRRSVEGMWPALIRPSERAVSSWGPGTVDLRGLPW
jgi:predicted N-acetyltransferase YhbS